MKLRVTGRGRVGADGMVREIESPLNTITVLFDQAIWFTEKPGVEGSVFGSNDQWNGLGIFLDSFDNDALVSHGNELFISSLDRNGD